MPRLPNYGPILGGLRGPGAPRPEPRPEPEEGQDPWTIFEPRLPIFHPPTGKPDKDEEEEQEKQAKLLAPFQTHALRGRPPVGGLNSDFMLRLQSLQNEVNSRGGHFYIFSGPRTKQEQMKLFNNALAKYGNEKEAMKRVKLPGKSSHDPEFGLSLGLGPGALGVDLRGDLHIVHQMAPNHGLVIPNPTHPWHIEMAGLDKIKT